MESSSNDLASGFVLAAEDAANLEALGLLTPVDRKGYRRIHKRRLNRSSEDEYDNIPLNSSSSDDAAFDTIPDKLFSEATFEKIGFSADKATKLWAAWTHWAQNPIPGENDPPEYYDLWERFVGLMTGPFDALPDTLTTDVDEWEVCMEAYGLSEELEEAIMDPAFALIRDAESCRFWAEDTVRARFEGLEAVQEESRERERRRLRFQQRPGADTTAFRTFSETQRDNIPGLRGERTSSASAAASRNAPGVTVLYKAVYQTRVEGLLDHTGTLDRLSAIMSSPPGDFCPNRGMYYFTPSYEAAEYYAAFAKRRVEVQNVVVVHMSIPNSAIEALPAPRISRLYWPSREWREMIFTCRRQGRLSTEQCKIRDSTIIIGTIARRPNHDYLRLASAEETNESHVLQLGSAEEMQPQIQYAFNAEEGEDFLVANVAGIKLYSWARSDSVAFLRRIEGHNV